MKLNTLRNPELGLMNFFTLSMNYLTNVIIFIRFKKELTNFFTLSMNYLTTGIIFIRFKCYLD